MARLRTWEAFEARGLWPGERKLVDACKAGEECNLGDGTRPDGPSEARNIRADLLRYLILGGCEGCRTDETGVQLVGAYVTGQVDLSFARARGEILLLSCRIDHGMEAHQAKFESLNLSLSSFPGLNAQGAEVKGDLFLRSAKVEGEANLSGAHIGGQLGCEKAKFLNAGGDALNSQGISVTGDVFLRGVEAKGEVSIGGAKIGGQLSCTGADFRNERGHAFLAQSAEVNGDAIFDSVETKGRLSVTGAVIRGQLSCSGATFSNSQGWAFSAHRLRLEGGLHWRGVNVEAGCVDFSSAHVSDLVDDLESWPEGGRVILDGFTYDRISGAFLDAPRRLEWLRRGTRWNGTFLPQPYTQLAKVLREMGHDRTARAVLIERSTLIRKQVRADARIEPNGEWGVAIRSVWADLVNAGRWGWGCVLYGLTGYGYAPWRSVWGLVVLLGVAWVLAWGAWQEGSFAPNDGAVLVSEAWQEFADDPGNPAAAWSAEGAPGMDWDSFNAFGYAADLVVPILDLGQTEAWAPSKDRGSWGWGLWWGRWVLSALGWVVTALGAAAITGITQPRRE